MHTIDLAAMVAQVAHVDRLTQAAARRSALARATEPDQRVGATRSSLAESQRAARDHLNRRAQGPWGEAPTSHPGLRSGG